MLSRIQLYDSKKQFEVFYFAANDLFFNMLILGRLIQETFLIIFISPIVMSNSAKYKFKD